MGAQRQVARREVLRGEVVHQLGDVLRQLVGDGRQVGGGLAVPEAVLQPQEAGEALVLVLVGEAVRPSVDLAVEVGEGAVGGAQRGVLQVRDEPVGPGRGEVAGVHVGLELLGLRHEGRQALVDVLLVGVERALEVVLGDRLDGLDLAAAGDVHGGGGDGLPAGGHAAPGVVAGADGGRQGPGGAGCQAFDLAVDRAGARVDEVHLGDLVAGVVQLEHLLAGLRGGEALSAVLLGDGHGGGAVLLAVADRDHRSGQHHRHGDQRGRQHPARTARTHRLGIPGHGPDRPGLALRGLTLRGSRRRRGSRGARTTPDALDEHRHHDAQVRDVPDDLQDRHGDGQVERALDERGVPGRGVQVPAQVEGVRAAAADQAGLLKVAQAVAEHARRDDDQPGAGDGEEPGEVHLQRAPVQRPAEPGGEHQADGRADQRPGGLPGGAHVGPQEERGLQAFAGDREEAGEDQRAGADRQRGLDLLLQFGGEGARRAPHPEHHRGDEADRDQAEHPAERLLGVAGEVGGGEGEHRTEAQAECEGRRDARPHLGQPGLLARPDQRGDQDRHDQSGFQALAQPDQEAGKRLIPHAAGSSPGPPRVVTCPRSTAVAVERHAERPGRRGPGRFGLA